MQMRGISKVRYNGWLKSTPAKPSASDGGKFHHESVGGKVWSFVSALRDVIQFPNIFLIRKRAPEGQRCSDGHILPAHQSHQSSVDPKFIYAAHSGASGQLIKCSNSRRHQNNVSDTATSTYIGCSVQIVDEASLPPPTETKSCQIFTWTFCYALMKAAKRHWAMPYASAEAIDWRVKLALKAFHSSESIINVEALMDINDSALLCSSSGKTSWVENFSATAGTLWRFTQCVTLLPP